MKSVIVVTLTLLPLMVLSPSIPPAATSSPVLGVFVGTSPCDAASRSLLNIPETADCELIKWELTLYQDPGTLAPTTYKLNYVYGLPQQGTNGVSRGGTKVERQGKWVTGRGTKIDPHAVVYRLDPDAHRQSLTLIEVGEGLLHLAGRDERLMVGNAGWSYTLNRSGGVGRLTRQARPHSTSGVTSASATAPAPQVTTGLSALETFVGRSPCRDVARQLNREVGADCMKVKWDLTLYRDPHTLAPTTYKLKGTFYRQRVGEGTWKIVMGTKTNPGGVIYQLDPDNPSGSLSFLKWDDNILFFLDGAKNLMVGNGDFSYTLNKAVNMPEK